MALCVRPTLQLVRAIRQRHPVFRVTKYRIMELALNVPTTNISLQVEMVEMVHVTVSCVRPMLQLVRQTPPQQVVIRTISCIQMEHAFLVRLRGISIPAEFVLRQIAMHTRRAAFRQPKPLLVNQGIN